MTVGHRGEQAHLAVTGLRIAHFERDAAGRHVGDHAVGAGVLEHALDARRHRHDAGGNADTTHSHECHCRKGGPDREPPTVGRGVCRARWGRVFVRVERGRQRVGLGHRHTLEVNLWLRAAGAAHRSWQAVGMVSRDDALALDASDPLATWRDQFDLTAAGAGGHDLIYLDGNSLGRTPLRTFQRMEEVLRDEWAGGLIRSWDEWIDRPREVGDVLAPLIGAAAGEVVVHDSTTVNLYQLVHGALGLRPDRTVLAVDENEFPSDRYVVDGIATATGRTVRHGFERLDDVAVVVRSVVDYRTAEVVDVVAETARAHQAGAMVVWDLSHAAGVLAIDLHAAGAQLAVGCTYKYLNGGPGSPAFTYVAGDLQGQLTQPIWGWFSQQDQFAMGPHYTPQHRHRPNVDRDAVDPGVDRCRGRHRAVGRGRHRGDRRQGDAR